MNKVFLYKILTKLIHIIPVKFLYWILKLNNFDNIIYGTKYKKYKKYLNQNKRYFDNTDQLIELINYSIKNISYYKNYSLVSSKDEFTKNIPFIDKAIINKDRDKFISKDINIDDYSKAFTGGTSGMSLELLIPKDTYVVELGTMHTIWANVGFKNHIRAVIRNNRLPKDKNYIINPITKEYIFDGFRLNDEYFQLIYDVIKKNNIQFIHAYPSIAFVFSKFLYKKNLDTKFIKAFLSGSENIYPFQKDFIRNKLGIKFYGWYGHSEKMLLGGYCEYNDLYHMEPTYGHVEIVNEKGENITEVGEIGEIVATTLHNKGMPLIRYKTNDFAEFAGNYCHDCNREVLLLKNIQGRRDGTKIYTSNKESFTTGLLEYDKDLLSVIDGLQHIQKKIGELDVYIIKNDLFTLKSHNNFLRYYSLGFYTDMKITIHYVDTLKKHPNGKFIELISEIKENE